MLMMRNLSPNNRQIILDRSRNDGSRRSVTNTVSMQKCKFITEPKPIDKFAQLERHKRSFKAVEESSRMNPEAIERVVNSVNYMSRQLLSDCKAISKSIDPAPLNQYASAIAAVTQPSIAREANKDKFEYQTAENEAKGLYHKKRV